jgi:ubiquinone/menaquinone biosynthesis C-methylase UbiE
MDLHISQENLDHRTVLEVGSGRGDTTRYLANLLAEHAQTRLIVTDISDQHFTAIRQDILGKNVQVAYHQTSACDLTPINDGTVDFLVCNYTLCAINALSGQLSLALCRFHQVLKPGGVLFVEEEYPITTAKGLEQEIWAEKWRILKAASVIAGELPFQEIAPEILSKICDTHGFTSCMWEADGTTFADSDVLQFFQARLNRFMAGFPCAELIEGFRAWKRGLIQKYQQVGSMKVPYYRFRAVRKAGAH